MNLRLSQVLLACVVVALSFTSAFGQNETPSSRVAVVVAPVRFQADRGEAIFLSETGDPSGQRYLTLSLQETADPGLNPLIDLLDHIERVDGTYSTGILLHTGHGGTGGVIMMESFRGDDAQATTACQDRLEEYENAGWDVSGTDREIASYQHETGWWAILMYAQAIHNRGDGLLTDHPIVYIAACHGADIGPAYVAEGARVALGPSVTLLSSENRARVERFFRRMNGRDGQAARTVAAARSVLTQMGATGAENTTLAPSVLSLDVPDRIHAGDEITVTLDTACDQSIVPDIVGTNCTIANVSWVNSTTLRGTCTTPSPPGVSNFTITLKWNDVYSVNNTARLDGNTNPPGTNAEGPAHDDYVEEFTGPEACIAYILDRSGSMQGVPLLGAKFAANVGITLMREQDEVGVVSFSSTARVNYPRTRITGDAVRAAARAAVNSLSASGMTSIGAGLLTGYNQLASSEATRRNYLLLSDGKENTAPWARDILPLFLNLNQLSQKMFVSGGVGATVEEEIDHTIHSIAYGPGADQVLLAELANATGGIFLFSPSVTDPLELANIFFTIQGEISDEQRFASYEGHVVAPAVETVPFLIGPDVVEETVSLIWDGTGNELSLALERPDSEIMDGSNYESYPGVTRVQGPGIEYFTITSPMQGDWIAQITAHSGSFNYALILSGLSTIRMELAFDRDAYGVGVPIGITATVMEGTEPILGATVTAAVQTPTAAALLVSSSEGDDRESVSTELQWGPEKGTLVDSEGRVLYREANIILFDDGAHGDGGADDGVYGAYFADTDIEGSYTFRVTGTGFTPSGQEFARDATRSTVVTASANQPPEIVSVDPASQEVQYSDGVAPVTITVTDPDGDPIVVSANPTLDALVLTQTDTDTWVLSGQMLQSANVYEVALTANDGQADSDPVTVTITVVPEHARVAFDNSNPLEVQVPVPRGNSGPFSLSFNIAEFDNPDDVQGDANLAGDIGLATVTVRLVPVGPGGNVDPADVASMINPGTADPESPFDYGVRTLECSFDNVPVNTYSVVVEIDQSGFYAGDGEDVLVVADPSLGFVTGGGHFYWPGTEDPDTGYPGDRTNCGFNVKYKGRTGNNAKGALLMIRHLIDETRYRLKSNAMNGLAIGESQDGDLTFGWASFVGKATYKEPGWEEPIGNYEFTAYIEDRGEPGAGSDRFWIQVLDRDDEVVPDLSFAEPATVNAVTITGGNIAVPHGAEEMRGDMPKAVGSESNLPRLSSSGTTIRFQIPEPTHVRILVYDVTGREVARLVDGPMAAGSYERSWQASNLASGIYVCRMQAGSFTATRRMMLLK
ncbi:MAG: VWA domain-containing protein [Candidatus Eisenbacteria sp.]|nr:VWA domain-containing protein [Candidatus Eisenbacteria bacterium]